jgi:hypothetical protein
MVTSKFGNVIVESSFPLGVATVDRGAPDCVVFFSCTKAHESDANQWFHHITGASDKPWMSRAKQGPSYVLRFHGLIDFLISGDGTVVCGHPRPGTTPDTIRHLFLDQVMPRVISHRGRLVLHASAVLTPQGVIAFLGDTGRGKSTLMASFCRHGFPGVADDCLILEEEEGKLFAIPSYSGLRLWPDTISALFGNEQQYPRVAHYTRKKRVSPDDGLLPSCTDRVPLRRLYVLPSPEALGDHRTITIEELSPREAVMALVGSVYRLDITDREKLTREFEALSQLAGSLGLWRLAIPRDFALLPTVQETVLKHLTEQK